MIIFFKDGRLGNQLFQYVGLNLLFPKQKIIFFGCDEITELLCNCSSVSLKLKIFGKFFSLKWIINFLIFFVRIKLIGSIREERAGNQYFIKKKLGLIPIFLVISCFFQHRYITDLMHKNSNLLRLRIKQKYIEKAENWLIKKKIRVSPNKLIFVHIRRGDYLSWPSEDFSASLSLNWYLSAIKFFEDNSINPHFIILSDDPKYFANSFSNYANISVSFNSSLVDMALMSLCGHGILSPSSYSWWGAWFSKSRYNYKKNIFIAPKYWIGHSLKQWYPEGFKTKWITYFENFK